MIPLVSRIIPFPVAPLQKDAFLPRWYIVYDFCVNVNFVAFIPYR